MSRSTRIEKIIGYSALVLIDFKRHNNNRKSSQLLKYTLAKKFCTRRRERLGARVHRGNVAWEDILH